MRELDRELGSPTRVLRTSVPPFTFEITDLKALTLYNMSVTCENEIGLSPPSPWVQSSTTEGGVCVKMIECNFLSFATFVFIPEE